MRIVIQRTTNASVTIDNQVTAAIGKGYVILVGIEQNDTKEDANWLIHKIIGLRIFDDEQGVMNLSIMDIQGEILVVSQFTLLASCKDGNRPSFIGAGDPKEAKRLYEYMVSRAKEQGIETAQGEFGADMQVELINDGPFTIVLDENNI